MNEKLKLAFVILTLLCWSTFARAQGTAFTYQGRLNDGTTLATGSYDLTFSLFDDPGAGNQVGVTLMNTATDVSNGLFVVTLDFGAGIFDGTPRWLEIGVSTNGSGSFDTLSPRQALTPTPYAIFAANSAMAASASSVATGAVTSDQLSTLVGPLDGQLLSYSGGSLSWIDPPVVSGSVWSLNGLNAYYNSGRVGIGTSQPATGLHVATGSFAVTGTNGGINLSTAGRGIFMSTFGGVGFISGLDYGNFPATAIPLVLQNGSGGVGIGNSPRPGYVLEVNGSSIYTPGGSGGVLAIATPNSETGMTINGGSGGRADLRFNGSTLKLVAGPANAIPSPGNGVAIDTSGNVGMGTDTPLAKLDVRGVTRVCVLTITGGCDVAEPFDMDSDHSPKGAVMVIDDEHPGRLKLSDRAYDRRVAGIVSGANGINPGISLQQEGALDSGLDVALSGRVYVQADAAFGAIKPGDLLTTSKTPGCAMKVTNHSKAQGAILGKAMSTLKQGKGMVLVLVTLQ